MGSLTKSKNPLNQKHNIYGAVTTGKELSLLV